MANIINLSAETGAGYVGDDNASPAITFDNTGTGSALRVQKSPAANNSIAALELGVGSMASGAAFGLVQGAFVSAVSIVFAASANWAGMGGIRVARSDGTFGWIPIIPDGSFTAAAR